MSHNSINICEHNQRIGIKGAMIAATLAMFARWLVLVAGSPALNRALPPKEITSVDPRASVIPFKWPSFG